MNTEPRIYVACLASYNAGILHGEWITLDGSIDIGDAIKAMLAASPSDDAEEYAVHDHESCGQLSEYAGMDSLNNIAEAYRSAEANTVDWELFCEFCSHLGKDLCSEEISSYEDCFAGSSTNLVSWCQEFLEETGQLESIPENLRFYFDYEAYARDIEINDVFTIKHNGETHVFWNR